MLEDLLPRGRWRPEVHSALLDILRGPPGVMCLDWDETCASGDIGEALLDYLDPSGQEMAAYQSTLATGEVLKAYVESIYVLAGMRPEEALETCSKAVEWALKAGRVAVRPEMRALMEAGRASGWQVWVVTASVTPLVQAFAGLYGLPSDRVLGMNLLLEGGVYQRGLHGPATYRKGKVEAIRAVVGEMPTLAAGDTLTDLEMLLSSKYGLVIGPRHPELQRHADQQGWLCQPIFEST